MADMAESKEKRDAVHNPSVCEEIEPQSTATSVIGLNDFCCLAILELLPLVDLYAMSQTCTRFEALCADVFCRRCPNKAIVIDSISDKGKVHQGLQEKYAKCFTKYIPNVTLSFGKDAMQDLNRLCKLYGASSCPIKSLQFKNWETKLERSHGVTMRGIVENIESVTFTGMEIGNVYDSMLQFMPNMKSLTFRETFEKSTGVDFGWMEKKFPKLENLAWYETSFPASQLKALIDGNQTIRHFSLLATLHETIEQLKDSSIRIDELFIDFDRFNHVKRECSDTLECLHILCTRQPEMRLHMKLNEVSRYYLCQHFDKLSPLSEFIEGLYFMSVEAIDGIQFTGPRLHTFIHNCPNLKVLQLNHDTSIDWTMLTPKLEKIHFYYDSFKYAMANVAYLTHQLKKVISSDTAMRKFNVYVSSVASNPSIGKLNERDGDSVEVIRTETEIVNNPLIFVKKQRIKRKGPRGELTELDRAMLRWIYS